MFASNVKFGDAGCDSFFKTPKENVKTKATKETLNFGKIRQIARIERTLKGYKIYPKNIHIKSSQVLKALKQVNAVDIEYSEDLEDNELINTTTEPLWVMKPEKNYLVIERNF